MPLGADRIGTRRGQLVATSLLILVGLVGIAVAPAPAVVWAVILGLGMGAIFPIVLTLPVDVGGRPADVAATAAMMLLVGYILSAVATAALRHVPYSAWSRYSAWRVKLTPSGSGGFVSIARTASGTARPACPVGCW